MDSQSYPDDLPTTVEELRLFTMDACFTAFDKDG